MQQSEQAQSEIKLSEKLKSVAAALTAAFTGSLASSDQISAAEIENASTKEEPATTLSMAETEADRYGLEDSRTVQQQAFQTEKKESEVYPAGTQVTLKPGSIVYQEPGDAIAGLDQPFGHNLPNGGSGEIKPRVNSSYYTDKVGLTGNRIYRVVTDQYAYNTETKQLERVVGWVRIKDISSAVTPTPTPEPTPRMSSVEASLSRMAKTHKVASGENLSSIAPLYGLTWQKLAEMNNIKAPYLLREGQFLTVSENASATAAQADAALRQNLAQNQEAQKNQENKANNTSTYLVQSGDTGYSIAARIATKIPGFTFDQLRGLNPGISWPSIIAGHTILKVPATALTQVEKPASQVPKPVEQANNFYITPKDNQLIAEIIVQFKGDRDPGEYYGWLIATNKLRPGSIRIPTAGTKLRIR